MIDNLFGIPLYISYDMFLGWLDTQVQFIDITFSNNTLLTLWLSINFVYLYIWVKIIFPLVYNIILMIRSVVR
jgi:hypothetical protein